MLEKAMEALFKQKLLNLRNPRPAVTFGEALLKDTSWLKKPSILKAPSSPSREVYSEKVQVIESLERFAQEKVKEVKTDLFKIPGGEVLVRPEPNWDDIKTHESLESLSGSLKLGPQFLDIIFKNKTPGKVQVLFVTEKFRTFEEISSELKGSFVDELIAGFPLKTAELFERMIGAMKLAPTEVLIYPVEGQDESDFSSDVMEVASFMKAEIIVTLGAKATNKILKSNDRLSMVHGQFFSRRSGETTFQVVPLFHPSIIETNQNMKKTAWTDMQKIMKHLKKLP